MKQDIDRILISEQRLRERVKWMADEIAAAYAHAEEGITIVSVLAGSIIFLSDLIRQMPIRMRIGLATVSSYSGETTTSSGARILWSELSAVYGRDVLLVDDILDTGRTLRLAKREVAEAGARSVRSAVLLRKPSKAPPDLDADFVGFDVEDEFVVGYGLDYNGLYRNLPFIAVLRPELYRRPNVAKSTSGASRSTQEPA